MTRLAGMRAVPVSVWFSGKWTVPESLGIELARALLISISHTTIPPFSVVSIPSLAPTPRLQLQIPHQSAQPFQLLVSLVTLPLPRGTWHCSMSLVWTLPQARSFFSSYTLPILMPFLPSFPPCGVPKRSYQSALGMAFWTPFKHFSRLSLSRTTAS